MARKRNARIRPGVRGCGWRDVAYVVGGVCAAVVLAWIYEARVAAAPGDGEWVLPPARLHQAIPVIRGSLVRHVAGEWRQLVSCFFDHPRLG